MGYLEQAKSIVAQAKNGADYDVEVIITESQETNLRVNQGEVEQLSQSGSRGLGVRVVNGGRTGYAYTSDFSSASIEQTWQTAVQLSRIATPDEHRKIPEPQTIPEEDLGIWDPSLADVSTAEKIEIARAVERAALDYDSRVFHADWCTYADSIDHTYLANSKGFAGEYGRTTAFAYVIAVARGEDEMMQAYGLGASNFFKDLDPKTIGEEAARNATSLLNGKPVPTQTASVVLDPIVGSQIIDALASALTAESWQKGRSFLMGKLNQQVGNDMVTLMDNGRLKGGLASAPFDAEGVPTRATRLIDEGVLQNLIYDSYSASKDGQVSTGNAQRSGHRSTPSLGSSNFYMQPGNKSPQDIIKGVEKGLYVLHVMQTGGIDSVTGDCSMSAYGLWIENGELQGAVSGVTIATTLNDFLNNISEVGNDLRYVPFGDVIGVPTLRIDNVIIGGMQE